MIPGLGPWSFYTSGFKVYGINKNKILLSVFIFLNVPTATDRTFYALKKVSPCGRNLLYFLF